VRSQKSPAAGGSGRWPRLVGGVRDDPFEARNRPHQTSYSVRAIHMNPAALIGPYRIGSGVSLRPAYLERNERTAVNADASHAA